MYTCVYISIYIDEHDFNRRTYRLAANYLDGKCLPNLNTPEVLILKLKIDAYKNCLIIITKNDDISRRESRERGREREK